ncbi:DUF3084 domain-containing protein|uniref:Uncharacterized conserved protein, contains DUF3084 domain n=1 Tax=Dendrosporobacter quercicolus TaxID=146817 RepID=A0A1G9WL30_9FIRM|nr:DUF3084 domain-containing protein [Dendrosporobacter quercicolus]NSL49143.1 DUF3084 domain-containing protein [Dendrosporobacter quercicolus DSM 1736]SDM85248.1 Uncharacterized conserved protein, contains DUF3084 domain [Dendrosporobacter quercicolus]
MYGIVLIAVLAVMGGAIAYIGDKLGTKVGKRKLSMFGLRPKHTSIIVTIITGILIASSTLGILSLASRDVRTALFGMEELKEQLSSLSQEVLAKNVELEASRKELEAKTAEYSTLNTKIKETAAKLSAITAELSAVSAERDRTAAALAQVQSDYKTVQGDLKKSRLQIGQLQTTKKELDDRVAELNEAKTVLEKDVTRLNDLTAKLNKGIQVVREGDIIYRAGEVLSTAVINGNDAKENITANLTGVILKTNQDILNRLGVEDKQTEALWIAQADFDQAVSIIAGNKEDVIVRVSSVGNIVYGEPVIGQIELFSNKRIYEKDEVVHSEVMNAGRTASSAEETVLTFLQKVNAAAIQDGIIADPIQGTVGVMSGSELYGTINRVKRYYGKVELTAVAQSDTYVVGPLKIDIRVKSVQ